jgi:Lon protease-like protein
MTQAAVYLPIFPLPDQTFFPHTLLPLHVFEARYRAMVTDALVRDGRLAVVGLRPGYETNYEGRPAVYAVAGAGRIVKSERLSTGRFNILLQGDTRIRIDAELPADTLYRFVRATPLPDVGVDAPDIPALAASAKRRCLEILEAIGRARAELRESLDALRTPAELCDRIAASVVPTPAVRQALLEEQHLERRLARLNAALDQLLRQLTGER